MNDSNSDLDLLIVDDDKPFLSRLSRAMEQRGYQVRSADSVKDGLTAIAERAPALAVIVVDPMLATGNSAIAAVQRLKGLKPKSIKFVCLLTCPEGIQAFQNAHPDVPIFTAAVDRQLNDHGYILPGLGDAGDRIFGTK